MATGISVTSAPRRLVKLRRSDECAVANFHGQTILLHSPSGTYFGLNEVGALIWDALARPIAVEELFARVLREYRVDPDQCVSDTNALVDAMMAHGLALECND